MVEPLRHRQTKGAETDMPGLPPPRHFPTLPHDRDVASLAPHRHGQGARGAAKPVRLRSPQLRRAPGHAGRSRGRRTRQRRARPTPASCQAAPSRLPRGYRLPHPARSRPQPDPHPRQRPLAARAQQRPDPGPDRHCQSFVAFALGHEAARDGLSVRYQRLTRLLDELALARVDGKATRLLAQLAKIQLLIVDDWAMARLTAEQRRDLMEVIDDRHQRASTILATQIPIERWHDTIGDPTYADAILDRLVHNAYRIELRGDSMRRRNADMPGYEKN